MMSDETEIRRGGANIFADLGYVDAETHLLKARLVRRIADIVADKGLTVDETTLTLGISGAELARVTRGQFRDVAVERLMRWLTRLGFEVDIVLHEPGRPTRENDVFRLAADRAG